MNMNDEQKVALDACHALRIAFIQSSERGGDVSWFSPPDYESHEDLVEIAPVVKRLAVMVNEDKQVICFGLECAWPVNHFHGYWNDSDDGELLEVLRLLASAYGMNFECVLVTEQESE